MQIEDITLTKELGKGAFGKVYLSTKQGCAEKLATKKISKKILSKGNAKKYLNNEILIMQGVDHPNIIKLVDVKKTQYDYYLVMEFCNGGGLSDCLKKYMEKNQTPFPEKYAQPLIRQIVEGLRYLHARNILHRDLKLDNILVQFENEEDKENLAMDKAKVKIIDFGFARYLNKGTLASTVLGTPTYMDPTLLKQLNRMDENAPFGYDQKADIWSLGVLCYEMIFGKLAYVSDSVEGMIEKIETKPDVFKEVEGIKVSNECKSFINAMIQSDSTQRKDTDYLIAHSFLTNDVSTFHYDSPQTVKKKLSLGKIIARYVKKQMEFEKKHPELKVPEEKIIKLELPDFNPKNKNPLDVLEEEDEEDEGIIALKKEAEKEDEEEIMTKKAEAKLSSNDAYYSDIHAQQPDSEN